MAALIIVAASGILASFGWIAAVAIGIRREDGGLGAIQVRRGPAGWGPDRPGAMLGRPARLARYATGWHRI